MIGRPRIPVRCPVCSSSQPFFDIADLHSYSFDNCKVVKELSGHRLACQGCSAIFSVGPQGTFKHNIESFPPSPIPINRQVVGRDQPPVPFEPDRQLPPVPRQRPEF
jgi:hypothetical protein